MQFIIKSYPSGKVSKALSEMKAGDEVEVKGPYKKYTYKPSEWTHVGLLAAGTGITPMYQLLQEALADPRDTTKFTLLYANRTPQDIILKEELDALAVVHPNRFKVVYTVDAGKQEEGQNPYKGLKGHFTQATLEENLPKASEADVKIMVCGPPGFYKAYSGEKKSASDQGELSGVLASLGFSPAQVFKY